MIMSGDDREWHTQGHAHAHAERVRMSLRSHALSNGSAGYLVAGCRKGSLGWQRRDPLCADVRQRAAIRCCGGADLSCVSICRTRERTGSGLSALPLYPEVKTLAATRAEAAAECTAQGRRLCTKAELQSNSCCKTGCDMDWRLVWASDACETPPQHTASSRAHCCPGGARSSGDAAAAAVPKLCQAPLPGTWPEPSCPMCSNRWRALPSASRSSPGSPRALLGSADRSGSLGRVAVVISHCTHSLRWMRPHLRAMRADALEVFVYSKCGRPVEDAPPGSLVRTLPNVGRCDHTFAHHLALQSTAKAPPTSDLVLFAKDTPPWETFSPIGWTMPLEEVVESVASSGFACGQQPYSQYSVYHDSRRLLAFSIPTYKGDGGRFSSGHADMGKWLHALNAPVERNGTRTTAELGQMLPLMRVCYGGVFAATRERIDAAPPSLWRALESALSRGVDSIEEGHFAERLWATQLSPRLDVRSAQRLRLAATCVSAVGDTGALAHCRCVGASGGFAGAAALPRRKG